MSEEHVLEINFCVKLPQSCTTVPRWNTLDAALTVGQMVVCVCWWATHTHTHTAFTALIAKLLYRLQKPKDKQA